MGRTAISGLLAGGCFLLGAGALFAHRFPRTTTADLCHSASQVGTILSNRRLPERLGLKAKGTRGRRAGRAAGGQTRRRRRRGHRRVSAVGAHRLLPALAPVRGPLGVGVGGTGPELWDSAPLHAH